MWTSKSQLITFFLLTFSAYSLFAQLPDAFHDEFVMNGFNFPIDLQFDDNGRLYVAEKAGRVNVIDTNGRRLAEPLLNITEEVSNWNDHGLLSMALDPNFLDNGYFYVLYAVDLHYHNYYGSDRYSPDSTITFQPTIGRVTRFQADPATNYTRLVPGSRKVLLGETLENGIPLLYDFHGLGTVLAAEDGTLLISCGDATSNGAPDTGGDDAGTMISKALQLGIIGPDQDIGSYRAQYLGSYNGKILRIDAETGDGLPSNPFFDPQAPRSPWSRIWTFGLRNPYRIALHPESGSHYAADGKPGIIYVGDVGNGAWEELNIVTGPGQNFGWPITEGIDLNWGFWTTDAPVNRRAENPLYANGNCDQPYFNFRDLFIRARRGAPQIPNNPCNAFEQIPEQLYTYESLSTIAWSNSRWNPPSRAVIPTFGETGGAGPLIVTDPASTVQSETFDGYSSLAGVFYQGNQYPEAYRNVYFAVDFSGWIKVFRFNDQQELQQIEPFHDQATDIIHLAVNPRDQCLYYLTLKGFIRKISYGGNPPPVAVIESDKSFGPSPLTVQFDASESFDGNSSVKDYLWEFGNGDTSHMVQPVYTFNAASTRAEGFTVRLTVTDSLGATATTEKIISLNNTPPKVRISSFEDGDLYPLDRTFLLELQAAVQDTEHPSEELRYEWRTFLHHNDHFHPDPLVTDQESFLLISPLGCEEELYWYRIELTVTDPAGLSATDSKEVFPNCNPIFVEWSELIAESQEGSVGLRWATQKEENVLEYQVQRSTDFYHYETIGSLPPTGANSRYLFTDLQPLNGNNIYRIKAVNKDRAFRYTNLATATYPKPAAIRIHPNPAFFEFELEVQKADGQSVHLELFNASGKRLLSTRWEATDGQFFSRSVPTDRLINGVYFYRVKSGEQSAVGKLVISK